MGEGEKGNEIQIEPDEEKMRQLYEEIQRTSVIGPKPMIDYSKLIEKLDLKALERALEKKRALSGGVSQSPNHIEIRKDINTPTIYETLLQIYAKKEEIERTPEERYFWNRFHKKIYASIDSIRPENISIYDEPSLLETLNISLQLGDVGLGLNKELLKYIELAETIDNDKKYLELEKPIVRENCFFRNGLYYFTSSINDQLNMEYVPGKYSITIPTNIIEEPSVVFEELRRIRPEFKENNLFRDIACNTHIIVDGIDICYNSTQFNEIFGKTIGFNISPEKKIYNSTGLKDLDENMTYAANSVWRVLSSMGLLKDFTSDNKMQEAVAKYLIE